MHEELKDLPIYQRAKQMGRPEFWTEKKITELCNHLLEWSLLDTSIALTGWRSEVELSFPMCRYLSQISEDFSYTYDLAKQRVSNRLATKAGQGIHPVHYSRYVSLYDRELNVHEIEMATVKASANAAAEAERNAAGESKFTELHNLLKARASETQEGK